MRIYKIKKYINLILILILIGNLFVFSELYNFHNIKHDQQLEIYFLNIGQGDSMLIKTPNGHWGLIDGGADSSVVRELDKILPVLTRKIEFAIFTHADDDHIDGLNYVMERYDLEYAFIHKVNKDTKTYNKTKSLIKSQDIKDFAIKDDDDFEVDGVNFNVIWPLEKQNVYEFNNINNSSISVEISYRNFSILSMGDIEKDLELEAIKNINSDEIDILKLSHHGSKTSTSEELLNITNPLIYIASAGRNNRFGHPHQEVLDLLDNEKLLITYEEDNIKIITDGYSALLNSKNNKDKVLNI